MKSRFQLYKFYVTATVMLLSLQTISAQSEKQKGDQAWEQGRFKTAVNNYSKVKDLNKNKKLLAKRGLGYFKLNQLTRAINDFTLSKKLGNEDAELYFYMAQTKQHLNEYEEAAFFYKEYIKASSEKSAMGQMALKEIKNCAYSAFHMNDKVAALIENFGPEINTYYDEVYVLRSPQVGNQFYFTSNRNLRDNDVYSYAIDEKGNWSEKQEDLIGINSEVDEYVMDISADGQSMLFNRTASGELSQKIFVSTFDTTGKQHIIELPEYYLDGAVDLQIVDRNTIAFASKELGGMGGYDIFTLNYKNGVWSDPINEGEEVNTEYDERSPCFATNMGYLYFSSNRPYCFGGFDIYYYNKLSIAKAPTNMGAPLNSAGNDLQFRMHVDGQMAVMSSDRKTGEGAYDIYQVYMQDFKPMPPKDLAQLEYVQDYFDHISPKEEVTEIRKTHLDKLKEKLGDDVVKQPEIEASQNSKVEEVSDDDVVDNTEQEVSTEEPIEEEQLEEEQIATPKDVDDSDITEMDEADKITVPVLEEDLTQEEVVTSPTKTIEEELPVDIPSEADKNDAVKTTEAIVETEVDETKDESDKVVPFIKEEVITQEDVSQGKSESKNEGESESKIAEESEKGMAGLPQKESGESPLSSIREDKDQSDVQLKSNSGSDEKNTIFYQDRHDLMNVVNKKKLNDLLSYLKKNKDHRVHFIAHTDHLEPGLQEYMQYNTLKRANLLSRYLLENGIVKDRISIESVCDNYPIAKEEVSGMLNKDYLAYNKRIDWEIRDEEGFVLMGHTIEREDIPGFASDRKYELFHQIREEVYYSVEIGNSPHIFKNAVLRLYDDIYIRKATPLATNKYYIGIYNNYEAVSVLQKDLAASSAPYSKIVAFYNGMPIKKSQLTNLAKDYPDLENYISNY